LITIKGDNNNEPLKCILVFMSSVIIQAQIPVCKQSNVIQHFSQSLCGASQLPQQS